VDRTASREISQLAIVLPPPALQQATSQQPFLSFGTARGGFVEMLAEQRRAEVVTKLYLHLAWQMKEEG